MSCKDDTQDANPNRPPTVTVISPAENASYNSGEGIPISLTISQSAEIESYRVLVRDQSTDQLLFFLSEFTSANEIVVDTNIVLNTSETTTLEIEVRAEDSFGNQLEEIVRTFTLEPPFGNKFGLRFNLEYNGETLLMNKQYEYPTGEQIEFSRFDMYISDLKLIKNGQEKVISDVDFLSMTTTYRNEDTASEGFVYKIAGLDDGDYDQVQFNIGISPELNATTPSDYLVSHPLGQSGEYWDSWNSYIFTSIEGKINLDTSNPDLEKGMALHLGSNEARKEISIPVDLVLANLEESIIDLTIDLNDLFVGQDGEIYDIVTTPQTHSLEHIPMVQELSENLKNSIKY